MSVRLNESYCFILISAWNCALLIKAHCLRYGLNSAQYNISTGLRPFVLIMHFSYESILDPTVVSKPFRQRPKRET